MRLIIDHDNAFPFGGRLLLPAGYNFDFKTYFPHDIYRDAAGGVQSTFNPFDFFPWTGNPRFATWDVRYLDNVSGNNANDGSTAALAKQSFSSMVTWINGTSVAPGVIVFVKDTGTDYIRTHGWNGGTRLTKAVCIVGYNGRPVMGLHDNATWALDGTYTTTYSSTTFTTFKRIVDLTNKDDYGDYTEFTEVATAAEVEAVTTTGAAGGKCCQTGSKIYVKRYDGAVVSNTNTRAYRPSVEGVHNPTTGDCYIWNMAFEGGNSAVLKFDSNTTAKNYIFNVSAKWGGANAYQANITPSVGVDNIAVRDVAFLLAKDCVSCRAGTDGFDFTPTSGTIPHGVLINCAAYRCGHAGNTSNNGITAHEGSKLLVLGGMVAECSGGNIALADTANAGTQAYVVGLSCKRSLGDIALGGSISPVNFQTLSYSKMWLDTCTSEKFNVRHRDFSLSGNSQLKYRNMIFTPNINIEKSNSVVVCNTF